MSDILTHTLYNVYSAPEGFCFDMMCGAEPVVNDHDSGVFNADKRVGQFLRQIEAQAKYLEHDNVLVTMGGDFAYQSAASWFTNMDNLISYVNSHQGNVSDVNIFYSSPSCYLKSIYLYGRRDRSVHLEQGDHLPYGSANDTYWTGFYSSRPSLKYLTKRAHVFLQVVKQLAVLSSTQDFYELHLLRHAVNLVLHHDAITGTSLQHVIDHFVKTLWEAVDACSKKISYFLRILTPTWGSRKRTRNNEQFTVCHQMNLSQCSFTETEESMLVVIYNPLSVKTYHHVRLPVSALHYTIKDYNDEHVEYQMLPLPAAVTKLPGRNSTALHDLYFEAENIPPLGFNAYFITSYRDQLAEGAFVKKTQQSIEIEQEVIPYISNEYLKVVVNETTGLLEYIQHHEGLKLLVDQNLYYYTQGPKEVQSGAYRFKPEVEKPQAVTNRVVYHTVKGLLVKEIRQKYTDWASQVIRLYRGEEFVELEWIVGPVPVGPDLGKEVVSIFRTNISNGGIFYTDSNSRQMMKRTCLNKIRHKVHKKPLPACYYPVTSRICLRSVNSSSEVCVLTDRTQGGTSYNEGEIELMIHRRLFTDDGFGLDEPLNEEEFGAGLVVRGKHRIYFGNYVQEVDEQSFAERASQMSRKWNMEPWLIFTPGERISRRKWRNVRNKRFSGLQVNGLPRHIHILTLEPWKAGTVLLRLENLVEKLPAKDESSSYIMVDLRKIFSHHEVKLARETTLGANHWLDEARQMDWSSRYTYPGSNDGVHAEDVDDKEIYQALGKQSDVSSEEIIRPPRRRPYKKRPPFNRQYPQPNRRNYRSVTDAFSTMLPLRGTTYKTKEREREGNTKNVKAGCNETEIIKEKSKEKIAATVIDFTQNVKDVTHVPGTEKYSFLREVIDEPQKLRLSTVSTTPYSREPKRQSVFEKQTTKVNRNESSDCDTSDDDFDDGITKSMYEMYYKRRPRKRILKPSKASGELLAMGTEEKLTFWRKDKKHDKRKSEQDDQYDTENRKSGEERRLKKDKKYSIDPVNVEDYYVMNDYLAEYEDHDDEVEKHVLRRRAPDRKHRDSSEIDLNEDFVFGLRPTQIRTFLVWFVDNRHKAKRADD